MINTTISALKEYCMDLEQVIGKPFGTGVGVWEFGDIN